VQDYDGAMGIIAWGAYLPTWRLSRRAIADALGSGGGAGTRSVASYDEDTTTMAVEAGRRALAALAARGEDGAEGDRLRPSSLWFSTPTPAYADKTNAAVIHQALDLPAFAAAFDQCGSVRSAEGAMRAAEAAAASGTTAMAVLSDLRTGLAGSADERDAGDGAVAVVFGGADDPPAMAEVLARSSITAEFLDRWRTPGEPDSRVWEERFGEEVYVPLAEAALADALKSAGLTAAEVDHLLVAGLHTRAVRRVTAAAGVRAEAIAKGFAASVGNLGAAQAGLLLADALDRAEPGEVIAVMSLADGADVTLWQATAALPGARAARAEAGLATVAELAAAGRDDLPYARFLSWRGALRREPPRRPDPERPGAPAMWRSTEWRGGFDASTCTRCGFRHLPPTRRCLRCHATDEMRFERLADLTGTVATFTVDHLAFSPSPPVVGVVVDYDGGGRYRCEMTDADPEAVAIGQRVEMTFRRISTAQGVHNYFWKARPVEDRSSGGASAEPAPEGAP
jgi:3-hydroxy-3-methylglutaryl CoA synthase/uncharacterized OB-fold protein